MQFAGVLDRAPVAGLRGKQDVGRVLDFGVVGLHRIDDGLDLRRVDRPHAQEAELGAGAIGIVVGGVRIFQVEGDVVRRYDAVGKGRGDHLGLGAGEQLVVELRRRAHRRGWNGAVVAGDKVHQAEIEHLHPGQAGDDVGFAQRAVGFDQRMDGDFALDAVLCRDLLDVMDHRRHLRAGRRLGDGDVGEGLTRTRDEDVDVLPPVGVGVVVHAHARLLVLVGRRVEQAHDHLGVFLFLAGLRAVFAVAGDVENRAELVLQPKRLGDQFLAAGKVLA